MRSNFPLLTSAALLQALVAPQAGDDALILPPTLLPVAEIPLTWSSVPQPQGGSIALTEQTVSGHVGADLTRTAGQGALVSRLLRLGQGLWDVEMWWSVILPAAFTQFEVSMQMGTPSGSGGNQAFLFTPTGNTVIQIQRHSQHLRVAVPVGHSFIVDSTLDNTAGASTLRLSWGAYSNKLLG